jgi:RNA polymerase sigma-70 factor (ECF subfamily)
MPSTVALDRLPAGPRSGAGSLAVESPIQHTEDLALVERMLAGDEKAFETFGERYSRALWRFTVGRLAGDRERTAEIVQTTLVKALAKIETYRGEASLLTWLCACCRNEVLMHFRSRRRAPQEVEVGEGIEPAAGVSVASPIDGEAALLTRERALRVHLVLDTLPAEYARALEWKYVENLSVRDIATRFERSEKSVESLLARSRDAFRRSWDAFTAPGS